LPPPIDRRAVLHAVEAVADDLVALLQARGDLDEAVGGDAGLHVGAAGDQALGPLGDQEHRGLVALELHGGLRHGHALVLPWSIPTLISMPGLRRPSALGNSARALSARVAGSMRVSIWAMRPVKVSPGKASGAR
jgi:hypothetical protein